MIKRYIKTIYQRIFETFKRIKLSYELDNKKWLNSIFSAKMYDFHHCLLLVHWIQWKLKIAGMKL